MRLSILFTYVFLMAIFLPTSCKKEKTAIPVAVTNNKKPPVAKAGEGVFSKDTVLVNVIAKKATAYDLDITYEGSYSVIAYPSWDFDTYYKYTEISGNIDTPPFGEMQILIDEYSDNPGNAFIHIRKGYPEQVYLEGNLMVNLGELIRLGGGSFNGIVNITQGSARFCDTNIFENLPPLTITGNLNVTGEFVRLRIKGLVYF